MTRSIALNVNGRTARVMVDDPNMPLLYALRNDLGIRGPRFGCGLGQCGACTVHLDGKPIRSCITPVGNAAGHKVTTLVGLADAYYGARPKTSAAGESKLHPVQQAWVDEQVPHCGSCQNGWIMYSAYLLETVHKPTDAQIRAGLRGLKCRCGSQVGILRAVKRAANAMKEA